MDVRRIRAIRAAWLAELRDLESYVEGEAARRGAVLKYSAKHSVDPGALAGFLYSPPSSGGYGLEVRRTTETGQPSTADEDLSWYASLAVPRGDDDPLVRAVLKIRSIGGSLSKYLDKFESLRRSDGCVHPKYNWALRTARLSAEEPPVHQIPERADREIADAVKSCIIPRCSPAPDPESWDPRIHGSCFRWDISGAEAAIRAAMFTHRFCSRPDPIAWEYIRTGRDIHSKTASLIYGVPEGTYKKGSYERDAVGKQTFFAKIFGAKWPTVRANIWRAARLWHDDEQAKKINANFDSGYTGLAELYEVDKRRLGELGYCEDAYGRRRRIPVPGAVFENGTWRYNREDHGTSRQVEHAFHVTANCVDAETEALTKRGWVKGFDLSRDDELLTKNAETGVFEWQAMLDLKLWPDYEGPLVEFKSKSFHAVTTPKHRWLVRRCSCATPSVACLRGRRGRRARIPCNIETTTTQMKSWHKIHLTGEYVGPRKSILTPDEAEALGWFVTDGSLGRWRRGGQKTTRGRTYPIPKPIFHIHQSVTGNPEKCARIDALLERLAPCDYTKRVRKSTYKDADYYTAQWDVRGPLAAKITSMCPDRSLRAEVLPCMSRSALDRLREAMVLGDGYIESTKVSLITRSKKQAEAFQILCSLTGDSASIQWCDTAKYSGPGRWNSPTSPGVWNVNVLRRRHAYADLAQRQKFVEKRPVWCPVVPNTFFVARRSGTVFVTGNTPTQSTNATDNIWMIALLYHGEYVELRVPPMWDHLGIPFPEAAGWALHEGDGPGGKPLRAWHMNTVHDSGWGDAAPGHMEPAAKVIWRRCHAVPLDWRIEADVPYRIDLQVGPNMAKLRAYNAVAKEFGLEPMPKR